MKSKLDLYLEDGALKAERDRLKIENEAYRADVARTMLENSRLKELNAELLAALKEEYAICAPLTTHGRKLAALISKAEQEAKS